MPRETLHKWRNRRAIPPIALLAATAGLSACGSTSSWLDEALSRDDDVSGVSISPGAPNADDYLRDLDRLATGDPATQIEICADAEAAAKLTPGPSTNLRLALVLATPGHSETDFDRAQSLLRDLLAQAPLMTPSEISLAHIYLNTVEERLVSEAETRRLRESNQSSMERSEAQALTQRLTTVEAENRELRSALAEAENKLEAITSIERSIREQSP